MLLLYTCSLNRPKHYPDRALRVGPIWVRKKASVNSVPRRPVRPGSASRRRDMERFLHVKGVVTLLFPLMFQRKCGIFHRKTKHYDDKILLDLITNAVLDLERYHERREFWLDFCKILLSLNCTTYLISVYHIS